MVQVLKRLMGQAVPNNPEQLMASRLLFDRALVRLTSEDAGAINLMESLPQYFKDGRERVFIG